MLLYSDPIAVSLLEGEGKVLCALRPDVVLLQSVVGHQYFH